MQYLLVAILSLALAAPALADHGPPVDADLRPAEQFWGTAIPCAHVAFAVPDGASPGALAGTQYAALAEIGGCRIWVQATWWKGARYRCETLVHEYGHLLGYGHSSDYRNVMYPWPGWSRIPSCLRAHNYKPRRKGWRPASQR